MNKVWSDAERAYISQNAATMKDKELADKIAQMTGRKVSLQALRKQRQKLAIVKKPGRGICGIKRDILNFPLS